MAKSIAVETKLHISDAHNGAGPILDHSAESLL